MDDLVSLLNADTFVSHKYQQGLNVEIVGASSMFTGQEEIFAFARAVSRLTEMSSRQYAELSTKTYDQQ